METTLFHVERKTYSLLSTGQHVSRRSAHNHTGLDSDDHGKSSTNILFIFMWKYDIVCNCTYWKIYPDGSLRSTAINVEKDQKDLLSDSCSESEYEEEEKVEEEQIAPKSRGGWAILEPMKGLFNQLISTSLFFGGASGVDSATSCVHSVPPGRIFGHPLDPSVDIPILFDNVVNFCLRTNM